MTIVSLPNTVIPEATTGIHRYFDSRLHEIRLQPDRSLCSCFMHHKASVGVLRLNFGIFRRLPVGVTAYPWWIKNTTRLERAPGFLLTLCVLVTAWWSLPASVWRLQLKYLHYQLWQAILVSCTVLLIQPVYELGWQMTNMYHKHK